jgi:hypothetical protein
VFSFPLPFRFAFIFWPFINLTLETLGILLHFKISSLDQQFPLEASRKADEVFKEFAPGYKREYFEGCMHGFAVRGDMSDPKVKAGKEGSFKASVETHLKQAGALAHGKKHTMYNLTELQPSCK